MSWDIWSSVSDGRTTPGSRVAVVPGGNQRLVVFAADPVGAVFTTSGSPDGGWELWTTVSEGRTAPGGTVTAVPVTGGRVALFLADPSGGVFSTSGSAETGWGPWVSVAEGHTTPGATVTAIPVPRERDRFAVFVADASGGVFTTAGNPRGGWEGWTSVSGGRTAPGGTVTALPLGRNQFAVFVADPAGGIFATSGSLERGWGQWSSVAQGRTVPGGVVTAVDLGQGRFALFLADSNGSVFTAVGTTTTGWGRWTSVSEGRTTPGAPVTPVLLENGRFALFLADQGGSVFTTSGSADAGWDQWTTVSEGRTTPGGRVSAARLTRARYGVLVADPSGGVFGTAGNSQGVPAPPDPGAVAGADILRVIFHNPDPGVDLRDPAWTKSFAEGTFPRDSAEEWVQVFRQQVGVDYDFNIVAATGWVVEPLLVTSDLPFAHPFGFDWEFSLAMDDEFQALAAPANDHPEGAVERARALNLPVPVDRLLGVEMERGMVPVQFRQHVQEGDRIAVFGRWIVDAGHDIGEAGFRTEIHPPLLMACAGEREVDGQRLTRAVFTSRPYLVSQTYVTRNLLFDILHGKLTFEQVVVDDDRPGRPFLAHILGEVLDVMGVPILGNPLDFSVAAEPKIKELPFRGQHLMRLRLRPPPQPVTGAAIRLSASFTFFKRSNVAVQVASRDEQTVEVAIAFNEVGYSPADLPPHESRRWTREELGALDPEGGEGYLQIQVLATLVGGLLGGPLNEAKVFAALERGILTDEYRTKAMENVVIFDQEHGVRDVDRNGLGAAEGIVTDNDQPYPLLGWMELKWVRASDGGVVL